MRPLQQGAGWRPRIRFYRSKTRSRLTSRTAWRVIEIEDTQRENGPQARIRRHQRRKHDSQNIFVTDSHLRRHVATTGPDEFAADNAGRSRINWVETAAKIEGLIKSHNSVVCVDFIYKQV
jgi:hypothetical protein